MEVTLTPGKSATENDGWIATVVVAGERLARFGRSKGMALHRIGDAIEWAETAAAQPQPAGQEVGK